MVLTWRAALPAVLGVVVAAVIGSWWGVAVVTGALIAVIAADLLLAASPQAVRAVRGGDISIRLGERARTDLLLTNPGRRALRGTVRDAWVPSAGATGGVQPLSIGPRQRRRFEVELAPTRRGDRQAGPVVVRSLGPLGVAGRQAQLDAPWTVRVLPPFRSRKHLPSRLARLRELDGRATILQRGQGTEFDSLRAYVPGDDVRSIDWRGTARSTTVVVRTWRPERDRHVLIVIDAGRTSAGRVNDEPRLDHLMDAALLLAALASKAGDRVDLMIVDRDVRVRVLRSSASDVLARFVEAMADVEPVLVETDHQLMVAEVLQRVAHRSLVVLLTGLEAATVTEGLLPVLAPVLRRHTVVLGAVADPQVDELAGRRDDAGDLFAAAAAELDRARRASTIAMLTDRGVSVVQAPPDIFAPALADHYLALKKAGRL